MSLNKGWSRSFGASLLAGALVLGLAFVQPEEACAGGACEEDWYSANAWGMGANCAAAKSACSSNAYSAAVGECASINKDVCQTGSISYNSCYASGGQIKVDCVLQFKCEGGPESPFD